jgi:hypothetical protein
MTHDMLVLARPARTRARLRRRRLAVLLLPPAIVAAMFVRPATVLAVNAETANIDIANVQGAFLYPCIPCTPTLVGLSSGDITGVDAGGNPFEVLWPVSGSTANFTGSMSVNSVCGPNMPAPTGGNFGGTLTITDADLVSGGLHSNASITGPFSGNWIGGVMVPVITSLTVTSGSTTLAITTTKGAGAVTTVPIPPLIGCSGTQAYTLSGTMLTAA